MTRYDFSDLLPTGNAMRLLVAAMTKEYPVQAAELARTAGITRYAAYRAVNGLVDAGMLIRSDYGLAYNPHHELASVVEDLAWRYGGVTKSPVPETRLRPEIRRGEPDNGDDDDVSSRMPASLVNRGTRKWVDDCTIPPPVTAAAAVDLPLGPDLFMARAIAARVGKTAGDLWRLEAIAQSAYATWKTERMRDMIHVVLHCGSAAGAANRTLMAVTDSRQQGDDDPRTARVPGAAWARATYLVAAEIGYSRKVLSLLVRSAELGSELGRVESKIFTTLKGIGGLGHQEPDVAARLLAKAAEGVAEREQLWGESHRVLHHIGGAPDIRDVGGTGDRVLAVLLHEPLGDLELVLAEMADAEAVIQWQAQFPAESAERPLPLDDGMDLYDWARHAAPR